MGKKYPLNSGSPMLWICLVGPWSIWQVLGVRLETLPCLQVEEASGRTREGAHFRAFSCRSDYHRGVFCYGDAKGNIIVFTSDNMTHGLFNPHILPRASKWGSQRLGELVGLGEL